jgi:hypothetical protein
VDGIYVEAYHNGTFIFVYDAKKYEAHCSDSGWENDKSSRAKGDDVCTDTLDTVGHCVPDTPLGSRGKDWPKEYIETQAPNGEVVHFNDQHVEHMKTVSVRKATQKELDDQKQACSCEPWALK